MADPVGVIHVLHADAHPDVLRPRQSRSQLSQSFRALRQHLEDVLTGLFHDFKRPTYEVHRHVGMEKIAHGVDENNARLFPAQRKIEKVVMDREPEPVHIAHTPHGLKPESHALGIAVQAARADLGAPG